MNTRDAGIRRIRTGTTAVLAASLLGTATLTACTGLTSASNSSADSSSASDSDSASTSTGATVVAPGSGTSHAVTSGS